MIEEIPEYTEKADIAKDHCGGYYPDNHLFDAIDDIKAMLIVKDDIFVDKALIKKIADKRHEGDLISKTINNIINCDVEISIKDFIAKLISDHRSYQEDFEKESTRISEILGRQNSK